MIIAEAWAVSNRPLCTCWLAVAAGICIFVFAALLSLFYHPVASQSRDVPECLNEKHVISRCYGCCSQWLTELVSFFSASHYSYSRFSYGCFPFSDFPFPFSAHSYGCSSRPLIGRAGFASLLLSGLVLRLLESFSHTPSATLSLFLIEWALTPPAGGHPLGSARFGRTMAEGKRTSPGRTSTSPVLPAISSSFSCSHPSHPG